jgi:hypothetical protein
MFVDESNDFNKQARIPGKPPVEVPAQKAFIDNSNRRSPTELRDDEIIPIFRGVQVIHMNLSKAENKLRKQMNLVNFQKSAVTLYSDFPMKFYRGVTRFYLTSNKLSTRISSNWSRFWSSKDRSSS